MGLLVISVPFKGFGVPGVVVQSMSPFTSLDWTVQKPGGHRK